MFDIWEDNSCLALKSEQLRGFSRGEVEDTKETIHTPTNTFRWAKSSAIMGETCGVPIQITLAASRGHS